MRNWKKDKEKDNNRDKVFGTIRDSKDGITYKELKEKTGLSDGCLSGHLKALMKGFEITKEDIVDGRSHLYFLTEDAIKDPDTQVKVILRMLKSKMVDCLDFQSIFDAVKDKSIREMTSKIEGSIINEEGKEEEKKKVDDISNLQQKKDLEAIRKDGELGYKSITFDPGFKRKEIADMGEKELVDFNIKVRLVGTRYFVGPLLKPKVLSSSYFVMSEFLERSKGSKKIEDRELYDMLIKSFTDMNLSYYEAEELDDREKEDVKKIMDNILGKGPLDRYLEYAKVLEKFPFLTEYVRTKKNSNAINV